MTVWNGPDGYWVSDDADLLDVPRVHEWLSTLSYWARSRPRGTTEKAIAHSLNLGLYGAGGSQVGFCRWVTDGATFAWLCDVFVESAHQGRGLGSFLVEAAINHPALGGVRQVLAAKPGRTLYARQGFAPLAHPERWMERSAGPPRAADGSHSLS